MIILCLNPRKDIKRLLPFVLWLICAVISQEGLHVLGAAPATAGAREAEIITAVEHSPAQPRADESVTITASLANAPGSLTLDYQVVDPGKYIALGDRNYNSHWISIPMEKFHSDTRYSATIPANVQKHRRLVRYRFKGATTAKEAFIAPMPPAPEPNYAYFVYNGTPGWKAAIQPKANNARSKMIEFSPEAMDQVQNYILIAKNDDVGNATWYEQSMDKDYRYTGTLVAHGKVYDHIRFRARGGEWRYAMGKNMWKFDFHKSNRLQARDDYDQPYKSTWSKLNLRACIQQGDYGRRGEQGMYEAVGFRLFNLAGVDSPRTHWISLRIIDEPQENPADQYRGDFWGLYLAIENEDGRFLEEHGLPDGNIYKMKFGQGELANHGEGQPEDSSDLAQLLPMLRGRSDPRWWRENVDLPRYYSYRSILEAIHHYDLDMGKNYTFYFNPENRKWCVIPWDIDLTWGDHMFGWGREPFMRPVLSQGGYRREYVNRQREIRDLLFNSDEGNRLIDECAAIISRQGVPSIVDADRAKWDFHPIMASQYVNRGKAGQGLFYRAAVTRNFDGMVQQMKDYVKNRSAWIDEQILSAERVPKTPVIRYGGKGPISADALTFRVSAYSGSEKFAAMKWRIAEVDLHPDFRKKPERPGHYEIVPTWESPEITQFNPEFSIPSTVVQPGHAYRVRARFKDSAGFWSHWSDPVEFTTEISK